jgi:hypothetical protein
MNECTRGGSFNGYKRASAPTIPCRLHVRSPMSFARAVIVATYENKG